jgi:hypothetical protein
MARTTEIERPDLEATRRRLEECRRRLDRIARRYGELEEALGMLESLAREYFPPYSTPSPELAECEDPPLRKPR